MVKYAVYYSLVENQKFYKINEDGNEIVLTTLTGTTYNFNLKNDINPPLGSKVIFSIRAIPKHDLPSKPITSELYINVPPNIPQATMVAGGKIESLNGYNTIILPSYGGTATFNIAQSDNDLNPTDMLNLYYYKYYNFAIVVFLNTKGGAIVKDKKYDDNGYLVVSEIDSCSLFVHIVYIVKETGCSAACRKMWRRPPATACIRCPSTPPAAACGS